MNLLTYILFFTYSSLGYCCVPSIKERDSLRFLYNNTNGNNWKIKCKHNWNFTSSNLCSFYGVYCNSDCNVVTLNLSSCNLDGYIASEISSLNSLNQLELGNNFLKGIPSLFQLNNLKLLNLSTNLFTGPISNLYKNFTRLQILD